MKTIKKAVLAVAAAVACSVAVNAQEATTAPFPLHPVQETADAGEDRTWVHVNLAHIQTLAINPAHSSINLNYETREDYVDGVSSHQENHLEVFSTGGFKVQVRSGREGLRSGSGSDPKIDNASVRIVPSGPAGPTYTATDLSNASIESAGNTIIESSTGTGLAQFSITYEGVGGLALLNDALNPGGVTTYSTPVQYRIFPL